ncbi:uncharacterized protein [Haliotis cracherodii]|uniref:uncharacterized protein n=1 Tax=Haliotis cracherodii TaxID=6455 RepID=UPI0039E90489
MAQNSAGQNSYTYPNFHLDSEVIVQGDRQHAKNTIRQNRSIQCKDKATAVSETIRSGDAYFDQCKDEAAAIRKSTEILRNIEVRSRRAAIMCYKTSSTNEYSYRVYASLASIVSALVMILTYPFLSKMIEKFLPEIVSSLMTIPAAATAIVVILGIISVIFVPSSVLAPYYQDRNTRYNKAAAGWQALELQISAFLATAIEGKVSSAEYKSFVDECIKKREEICLTARPDEKIYQEYQKGKSIYERDEKVNNIHKERIKKGWF